MTETDQKREICRLLRCLTCKTITKHKMDFIHSENFTDDNDYDPSDSDTFPDFWEERTYKVWTCGGCRASRFEITIKGHESSPDSEDEDSVSYIYPEYRSNKKDVKRFRHLDKGLYQLYREAVICYNSDANIACAACLRSLLEGILIERGITVDNGKKNDLYNKIGKLKDTTLVPETTINLLHSFRFMGNEALHQLKAPLEWELRFAVEAMEQLIYYIYEAQLELHEKLRILASFRKEEIERLSNGTKQPTDQ